MKHFEDEIHLSHNGGIAQYVRNLKEVVNPLLGVANEHRDIGNQQFQRFHSEDQSRKSPTKEHHDFRSQQYRQFRNDDQRRKYPTGYYRGDKNQASRFHENYNNNFYQGYEDDNIYNSIDMRLLKLALGGWN